jgi:hypothetical protein
VPVKARPVTLSVPKRPRRRDFPATERAPEHSDALRYAVCRSVCNRCSRSLPFVVSDRPSTLSKCIEDRTEFRRASMSRACGNTSTGRNVGPTPAAEAEGTGRCRLFLNGAYAASRTTSKSSFVGLIPDFDVSDGLHDASKSRLVPVAQLGFPSQLFFCHIFSLTQLVKTANTNFY